ncbi:testis-expressed protein 26 [Lingula anatina]|uniref:Testis-expressed protein 26 n=1 Tax=Lingula anatina TaxID=7574 RepID=A0A1S3KEW0_LINAN|nr:testis-expressed protein 26 [Lingula anatina]|eukprot:XP_013421037.1 testis-expressed protein 26 [Lingula anatina]
MAATEVYTILPGSSRGSRAGLRTPSLGSVKGSGDVRLGEDVLAPKFSEHLQSYITHSNTGPQDQRKALDLLTSLQLAEEAKEAENPLRPRTAMPALGRPKLEKILNPYFTTYEREYYMKMAPDTDAERPMTSRAFASTYELGGPIGATTYDEEFYKKPNKRTEPVRSGTASGARRNNPHPPESFMVWKFPKRSITEGDYSEWATPLSDTIMEQVMRNKFRSTYQEDFLGIPQGFQMKNAFDVSKDWKSQVPFTLDSSTRYSYQQPNQQPELQGNTSRYGCNRNKLVPASGAVPTCSERMMHLKTRTTYDREYNEKAQPRPLRDLNKSLGANAIQGYMATHRLGSKEREILSGMVADLQNLPRPPSNASSRKSRVPMDTMDMYATGPTWVSTWVGPT